MFEKLKKGLDEAYQGIKSGTSKVTLRAEEKTKLTRLNMKIGSLKKDLDGVMTRVGNRVYTFREEQNPGNIFQDPALSEILDEADNLKEEVFKLQQEMEQIREDYETRIQSLSVAEGDEAEAEESKEEQTAEVGKE